MHKTKLIHQYQTLIKNAQHVLSVLEPLESGYLYEFRDRHQSQNTQGNEWRYLVRVIAFNSQTIRFEVFACTQTIWNFQTVRDYFAESFAFWSITELKKIDKKDLCLYVGWAWKSSEFEKLLRGTSKIKLN